MNNKELIDQLKREKDAVILAHYYVPAEVQAVADYVGDSYYLGRLAADLPNKTLVFCGVSFMGESVKLLSPDNTVLMPDQEADCPMAHMVTQEAVEEARKAYDDLVVVCYVNSTAQIKSWADVCVTSSNAVKIVKNLPNQHILFIPDQNLARYVAEQVPDKHIIIPDGYCPIHHHMRAEEIRKQKELHPEAEVLAHPECNSQILEMADYIGSTSAIIDYAAGSEKRAFIIATEAGVLYELQQQRPDGEFYFADTLPVCEGMKKITLEKIIQVLRTGENAVEVEENLVKPAGNTLKRMLELAAEKGQS